MIHKETFNVITTPRGTSSLTIPLACATVETHYMRTTGSAERQAEICSTGLRVYEGAQVLSSFLVQYCSALLGPVDSGSSPPVIVELGCGCGLVGFTAAHAYKKQESVVIFTDASQDCLDLVCSSGALQDARVQHHHDIQIHSNLVTFPLNWSPAGVDALKKFISSKLFSFDSPIQLVLGSDIMYYRVDLDQLVMTVDHLLEPMKSCSAALSAFSPVAVLCHFMRIPNGREKLRRIVEDKNLGIAQVTLNGFLKGAVITERGWGGLEIVLIFPNPMHLPDVEVAHALFEKRKGLFLSLNQLDEARQCELLLSFLEPYVVESKKESIVDWLSIGL